MGDTTEKIYREICLNIKYYLYFEFSKITIKLGLTGNRTKQSEKSASESERSFHFGSTLGICVFAVC